MVEEVKELGTEVKAESLRYPGSIAYRERSVFTKSGPFDGGTIRVTQLSVGRRRECTRIKPELNCVYLRRTVSSATLRSALIRISDLIRPIQTGAVPCEVDPGTTEKTVIAVGEEQRESGSDLLNDCNLPVPEGGVYRTTPIAPPGFPFTKRKVINDTCRELVIEVDLGMGPIRLLHVGQRPVEGSWRRAKVIRQAGIVRVGVSVTQKSIKAVTRALGFSFFDLKSVVHSMPDIVKLADEFEVGPIATICSWLDQLAVQARGQTCN